MTEQGKLELLKLDLQISTDKVNDRLSQMLKAAEGYITTEGIHLNPYKPEDDELILMYAAYLWRSRKKENPVMPRPLRWALNNRLMREKARGHND